MKNVRNFKTSEEMVTIPKREYEEMKINAGIDKELLIKLVNGLEDVRNGRVSEWNGLTA